MKLNVLVGSGLSIEAGYPGTKQISDLVFAGQSVSRYSGGQYTIGSGGAGAAVPGPLRLVVAVVGRLRTMVDQHYAQVPTRSSNYEDVAYLAAQIEDAMTWEYDSPALQPAVALLDPFIRDQVTQNPFNDGSEPWSPARCLREVRHYIADVAAAVLRAEHNASHLGAFAKVLSDPFWREVNVFTLNHDTLLERTLRASGIEFVDGFGDVEVGVRYWNPSLFSQSGVVRRLLKVHGSVDWWLLRPERQDSLGAEFFHEDRIARVEGNPDYTRHKDGRLQSNLFGRPMILAGVHNKLFDYLEPPFLDAYGELYRHSSSRLQDERFLLVGYGGHDKAINSRIVEWTEGVPERRLAIVNRSGEQLEHTARGALARGIGRWKQQGRIAMLAKPVGAVSVSEYRAALHL